MQPNTRHNIAALVVLLFLLLPFTMVTDLGSDVGHKALLAVLGLAVVGVWRMCVNRWGPSGALAASATAVPVLVLLQGAVLFEMWPVPTDSLGVFVFTFPIWIAVVSLISGAALHLLRKRHQQAPSTASFSVSDA